MTYEATETTYDEIDTRIETWDELPGEVQSDLAEWLNCELDDDDRARLIVLYVEGRFEAWDCPHCGVKAQTRVFRADIKEDEWVHFQGSRNQDFSFFGDKDVYTAEYIATMCDSCRCYG